MPDAHIIEQSTRLISQIVDDLERLKGDFLALNMEEILNERPDLAGLTLLNLTNIKYYLDTTPVIFLSACDRALENKSD